MQELTYSLFWCSLCLIFLNNPPWIRYICNDSPSANSSVSSSPQKTIPRINLSEDVEAIVFQPNFDLELRVNPITYHPKNWQSVNLLRNELKGFSAHYAPIGNNDSGTNRKSKDCNGQQHGTSMIAGISYCFIHLLNRRSDFFYRQRAHQASHRKR